MFQTADFEGGETTKLSSARFLKNGARPMVPAGHGNGVAPAEAVARALGYTAKEQALAGEVLKRFVWRYVAQPSAEEVNSSAEKAGVPEYLEAAS
jgi:hypothetical protein